MRALLSAGLALVKRSLNRGDVEEAFRRPLRMGGWVVKALLGRGSLKLMCQPLSRDQHLLAIEHAPLKTLTRLNSANACRSPGHDDIEVF